LSLASLQRDLDGLTEIALDTAIFIAAADANDEWHLHAAWLLRAVEEGRFRGTISVINAAEILVGGFARSVENGIARRVRLQRYPNLAIVPLSLELATGAAQVRAATKLPLPDSVVLATAIHAQCQAIVHADREWVRRTAVLQSAIRIIYLGDDSSRG
jgi:predicted nucleic acid-binding protein